MQQAGALGLVERQGSFLTSVQGLNAPRGVKLPNGDEYSFKVDAGGDATIVACHTSNSNLEIPDKLGRHDVVAIGASAFSDSMSLKSARLPARLERIGDCAFRGCVSLAEVEFGPAVISIGEQAFAICAALSELDVPRSVRHLGASVAGVSGCSWNVPRTRLVLDEHSPFLFVDEQGALYERAESGLVLVDANGFAGPSFLVEPGTVEIGKRAFAQHASVTEVVLPDGLRAIGVEAFRGCTSLRHVALPESLEEIHALAFSCTALQELDIPEGCTRVSSRAFNFGPEGYDGTAIAYHSSLKRVNVRSGNPLFCARGGLLLKRMGASSSYEVVSCPGDIDEVEMGPEVARIAPTAFAGTYHIGHLKIAARLCCAPGMSPLVGVSCDMLTLEDGVLGQDPPLPIDLEIPQGAGRENPLESLFGQCELDIPGFLESYDRAVLEEADELARSREMSARLANPQLLSEENECAFRAFVNGALESICVHFGQNGYWRGFDDLISAHVLDEETLPAIVGLLSSFGDAPAAGYLLGSSQCRHESAVFDYAL